jgi:hypothetical protein
MAVLFFLLSILFNAVGAIIEALEEMIVYILGIVVIVILLFLAFNLIIGVVANWGNLWHFIGTLVLSIVGIMFIVGIIVSIGGSLFEIVVSIALAVVTFLYDVTEKLANGCENCFNHFVRVINNSIGIS